MHRFAFWLTTSLASVALVVGGFAALPASAETVICTGVSKTDVKKCDPESGYADNMSKSYWSMYGGHNCTNYAAYRLSQNGVSRPTYNLGNANTWASRAKAHNVPVTTKPGRGSIGVWDGRNHLVYVEEVGNGYLIIKEDNYPGYWPKGMFRTLKVRPGERNYPQRFIHFEDLIGGAKPTVSGTPQVGQTLRVDAGTWSPSGVALAYQWRRDSKSIAGATGSTYLVGALDEDRAISVRVTGTKNGYDPLSMTSATTMSIAQGTVRNTAAPTVSGEAKIGWRLTAAPGVWSPGGLRFGYQWLLDGKTISGATAQTYTPIKEQLGHTISVKVIATAAGYRTRGAKSAATKPVVKPPPPPVLNRSAPALSGHALVGSTLKISKGAWEPKPTAYSYLWIRDGKRILGATKSSYKLTKADLGSTIRGRVYARRSGYTTRSRTSASTAVVKVNSAVSATVNAGHGAAIFAIRIKASYGFKPTGTVSVKDTKKTYGTARVANGVARIKIAKQKKGTRTYWVRYAGTAQIAAKAIKLKVSIK